MTKPFPKEFSFSLIVIRFPHFLSSVAALVSAERDLGGYCGGDPAVDVWIRDAEVELQYVLDEICVLSELPVRHDADAYLLRVVKLFRVMLLSDNPAQVAYLRKLARASGRFLLTRDNPLHFRLNRMIVTALEQFETLLLIDDGPDSGADTDGLAAQGGDSPSVKSG